MDSEILLSYRGIGKKYTASWALKDLSFDVKKGSVHAIIGGNGAGKSTLMRITTGSLLQTEGKVFFSGRELHFSDPGTAAAAGIAMVPQVVTLCDPLTVTENLFLNDLSSGEKRIHWKKLEKEAENLLNEAGIRVSPRAILGELPLAKKQLISILRAVRKEPELLILDEPSAVLTDSEIQVLYELLDKLKEKGITVLYISHRLEEIFRLSDEITVLRDGRLVGTYQKDAITKEDLVRLMVGREVTELSEPPEIKKESPVILRAENITTPSVSDVSFELRQGEILGIAGLVGSGRTELLRAILGIDSILKGSLWVKGREVRYSHIQEAIEDGFGLLPEDRVHQGLINSMSSAENISLSSLKKFTQFGFLNRKKELENSENYRKELRIKTSSLTAPVRTLSGGNQQKVALARWMTKDSDILVLDEPTQGIDVAAKSEIYSLIREMAAEGKTVILVSSETSELTGLCRRVIVMREGRISGELKDGEISKEAIMALSMAELSPRKMLKGKKKKIQVFFSAAVLLLLAVLVLFVTGKKTGEMAQAEIPSVIEFRDTDVLQGKRIDVCMAYKGDEWVAAVCDAFEAIGGHYGAELAVLDGDLNSEVQTRQIENFLSGGCDMIMVDPCSSVGLDAILSRVVSEGIPLLIFDQAWENAEGKAITSVSWEQYMTGKMIGEYILDYLREKGEDKACIAELTIATAENNLARFQGLHDVLDNAGDIEISYTGKYDYQGVREQAEKAISAIAVPFDFVVSDSDNGAQGALVALRQSGNQDVKVLSMGSYGEECFLELYRDDPNLLAVLNVDAWVFTDQIIRCAIDYFEGKELPAKSYIPLYVVDHGNVGEFWDFGDTD